jgi:hypothetical protein
LGTAKSTVSGGEKLEGRVEKKEVVVVPRTAASTMTDFLFFVTKEEDCQHTSIRPTLRTDRRMD